MNCKNWRTKHIPYCKEAITAGAAPMYTCNTCGYQHREKMKVVGVSKAKHKCEEVVAKREAGRAMEASVAEAALTAAKMVAGEVAELVGAKLVAGEVAELAGNTVAMVVAEQRAAGAEGVVEQMAAEEWVAELPAADVEAPTEMVAAQVMVTEESWVVRVAATAGVAVAQTAAVEEAVGSVAMRALVEAPAVEVVVTAQAVEGALAADLWGSRVGRGEAEARAVERAASCRRHGRRNTLRGTAEAFAHDRRRSRRVGTACSLCCRARPDTVQQDN